MACLDVGDVFWMTEVYVPERHSSTEMFW